MVDTGRPLRVLVAGEAPALNEGALELLLGEIGGRPGGVVIVGVARPPAIIAKWAPLSGVATPTPDSMAAQALQEASVAARAFASLLPERVSVQYMAAGSWSDALRLASDEDLLMVIGRPQRRSDRRALGRAARVVPGARNAASGVMLVTLATGGAA